MTPADGFELAAYFAALLLLTPVCGTWIARMLGKGIQAPESVFSRIDRLCARACGIDLSREMTWKEYTRSMLTFNAIGLVVLFLLQVCQGWLPMNGRNLPGVPWDLALNTAVSFVTNTNWQSYSGESTMSNFVQMTGLGVQNFLSAGTGIAVFLALVRGFRRKQFRTIGDFRLDLMRSVLYILLPLSFVFALVLVSQGTVQTFHDSATVTTLEGPSCVLPLGPAASQIAIKQLGTNGGGFFGANSAHPFENPTPFSNFLELLAILLIPSALVYAFGLLIGSLREARVLWLAMALLLTVSFAAALWSELAADPVTGPAGTMEGKEFRFGVPSSVLWSTATTAASNGSVNGMLDSCSPLAGGMAALNILLGEVIFGGVGAGMYGMLVFAVLAVFIAGLMVGRTPEYLGKKIEARDITMAVLAVLIPNLLVLLPAALALVSPAGLTAISNPGPHGLTQVLYAFASASGNNGSAFAGLGTNTVFYNLALAACMLGGRFGVIIPVLALAGNLAAKNSTPVSSGTFRTDTTTFGILLVSTILIIGALTFFIVLSLGPLAEHVLLMQGRSFQ